MKLTPTFSQPAVADVRFGAYSAPPTVYDEMHSAHNTPRPHWRKFIAAINKLGPQELDRRWEHVRRFVQENRATYSTLGESEDQSRAWELDALPLLLEAREFRAVSEALAQRVRLLNLILADLYGPQRLLQQGLLPAELVFRHPGFLQACHGVPIVGNQYLHIHAADVVRSADGHFWVVADRTEAPSGSGYALENRLVASRMFPDLIHDCQVERLAPYFIALQQTLQQLVPRSRENPRIVLLSPGAGNRNYFEDVYLARYLNYTLVEAADLAVRDNAVFLKTLGGLLPVDVILRRVSSADCDSLELRRDSLLGVTGLLQAIRAGNVVVANGLGSGIVESPAFMAFLPALCRELLSEELKMPSVATWWCGDADVCQYVIKHLNHLVIKPTFRTDRRPPVFGDQLSSRAADELIAAIQSSPGDFVAQEQVSRSCAPVWLNSRFEPWHADIHGRVRRGPRLDAWRAHSRRTGKRHARTEPRSGRTQQRRLDSLGMPRPPSQPAAAQGPGVGTASWRNRPFQPRGRQPILVGTPR